MLVQSAQNSAGIQTLLDVRILEVGGHGHMGLLGRGNGGI